MIPLGAEIKGTFLGTLLLHNSFSETAGNQADEVSDVVCTLLHPDMAAFKQQRTYRKGAVR